MTTPENPDPLSPLEITPEMERQLNQIFSELTHFFHTRFIQGFTALSPVVREECASFRERLTELGADTLAQYLDQFIVYTKAANNEIPSTIYALIDIVMRILTYIRVFERVQTKMMVLNTLDSIIRSEVK